MDGQGTNRFGAQHMGITMGDQLDQFIENWMGMKRSETATYFDWGFIIAYYSFLMHPFHRTS